MKRTAEGAHGECSIKIRKPKAHCSLAFGNDGRVIGARCETHYAAAAACKGLKRHKVRHGCRILGCVAAKAKSNAITGTPRQQGRRRGCHATFDATAAAVLALLLLQPAPQPIHTRPPSPSTTPPSHRSSHHLALLSSRCLSVQRKLGKSANVFCRMSSFSPPGLLRSIFPHIHSHHQLHTLVVFFFHCGVKQKKQHKDKKRQSTNKKR